MLCAHRGKMPTFLDHCAHQYFIYFLVWQVQAGSHKRLQDPHVLVSDSGWSANDPKPLTNP